MLVPVPSIRPGVSCDHDSEATPMKNASFLAKNAVALGAVALSAIPAVANAGFLVFEAAASSPAGIQATVDSYRAALGTLNANTPGSVGSGRREINWDGVPAASSDPNPFAGNFFNANAAGRALFGRLSALLPSG